MARSKDGSQYQLGWSVELKNAKPQDFTIELFDEEGYSALKRQEEGSANLNVKPLTTVTIQATFLCTFNSRFFKTLN